MPYYTPQAGDSSDTPCTGIAWENLSLITEHVGKAKPVSAQRCTVTGHEAVTTGCKMGILVKYKYFFFFFCECNQMLLKNLITVAFSQFLSQAIWNFSTGTLSF